MWRIVCVVVLALASCGGDDGRTLEEWLAGEVPDVDEGQVDCVAGELRADHDGETLDGWTEHDVSGWSEQDYLDHPEVSGALADASFACATGS